MEKYTKTYLTSFGYSLTDNNQFVNCECCDGRASEIHHILNKNRLIQHGLLKVKDDMFNIMAICRQCHDSYGEDNVFIPLLFKIHIKRINGVFYNKSLVNKLTKYYEDII